MSFQFFNELLIADRQGDCQSLKHIGAIIAANLTGLCPSVSSIRCCLPHFSRILPHFGHKKWPQLRINAVGAKLETTVLVTGQSTLGRTFVRPFCARAFRHFF